MKIRLWIVLVLTLASVSACVVSPGGGGYRSGYGGGERWGQRGDQHDSGRRVWR